MLDMITIWLRMETKHLLMSIGVAMLKLAKKIDDLP